MIPLSIEKLAEIINAQTAVGLSTDTIASVSIDSRKITPHCVFFAIKGENHDGHDYLKQVFENGGACAVICDKSKVISGKPILIVRDTIKALSDLAAYVRRNSSYKVVAVTGSAGKTTTKNIISCVLKTKFRCYTSPKSFNNHIGVPLTILDAPADTEILIAELGSNHPGEIEQLARMIEPDIAVVTAIVPAHLEGFGSLDGIKAEKASIAKGLQPTGRFFITSDLADYCTKQKTAFQTFAEFDNVKLSAFESTFEVEGVKAVLPLAGRANVSNAAAAWTVCKNLGISADEFANAVATIKPVDMRMECLKIGSAIVLADCYNANPGSMTNALETLYLISQQEHKRAVFIFGRMGELGCQSEFLHSELGKTIVKFKIPVVLTIKGDCSAAVQTAYKTADYDIAAKIFENLSELCDNLYKFVKPDDIILVKASRSEHFEAVVERLKRIFLGQQ